MAGLAVSCIRERAYRHCRRRERPCHPAAAPGGPPVILLCRIIVRFAYRTLTKWGASADEPEAPGAKGRVSAAGWVDLSMDQPWQIELLGWLRATQGDRVVSRFRSRKAEA